MSAHGPTCWCDACLERAGRATLDTAPVRMVLTCTAAAAETQNRIAYAIGADAIILETTGANVRPTMGA